MNPQAQSRRTFSPVFSDGRGRLNPALRFMYYRAWRTLGRLMKLMLQFSSSTFLPYVVLKPCRSAQKNNVRHRLKLRECIQN